MKVLAVFFQIIVLLSVSMAAKTQSPNTSTRSIPIGVGDMAPEFSLEDQNGQKVKLSSARGKSSVVLVFYRGYW